MFREIHSAIGTTSCIILDQSFLRLLSECLGISRKLYIHGSFYISASVFHATDQLLTLSFINPLGSIIFVVPFIILKYMYLILTSFKKGTWCV